MGHARGEGENASEVGGRGGAAAFGAAPTDDVALSVDGEIEVPTGDDAGGLGRGERS